jgi:hypothetical protein
LPAVGRRPASSPGGSEESSSPLSPPRLEDPVELPLRGPRRAFVAVRGAWPRRGRCDAGGGGSGGAPTLEPSISELISRIRRSMIARSCSGVYEAPDSFQYGRSAAPFPLLLGALACATSRFHFNRIFGSARLGPGVSSFSEASVDQVPQLARHRAVLGARQRPERGAHLLGAVEADEWASNRDRPTKANRGPDLGRASPRKGA